MSIEAVILKKIGRELFEWIFLGIRAGARGSVRDARKWFAENENDKAIMCMKRAVDMPHRARARINEFVAQYGTQFLLDAISAYGGVTWQELDAELTALENYAQGLYDAKMAATMTWEEIATDIENNVELEVTKWIFPFPQNYTDIWGE